MKVSRDMTNLEIAELLRAAAASYKLKDENKNRFKIIAYERAADAVEHLSSEAKDVWDEGKLEEVGGIGASIAKHLDEIFRTGKSKHFEELFKGVPEATFELMKVPGIGAKTAVKLAKELGITKERNAIKKLEEALNKGKIAEMEGFGEQSEESLKKSIKEIKGKEKRLLLSYASRVAHEVTKWMEKESSVERVDALGSLRRKASTIGDIDLAAATKSPQKAIEHFAKYPKASRVLEKGTKSASIILPGNIQVDLLVQTPKGYGATLQHFTGSKHHNIAIREYALKKGLSVSDYGIKKKGDKTYKEYKTEEEFYKALGMEWIPPELREDKGEITASLEKRIPRLIELKDIKGDLQIHSDFDIETSHDVGESSMEKLIEKGGELGYEYLAFTEHNPSQRGHNEKDIIEIIKRKKDKIEQINSSGMKTMKTSIQKVFNSLEIDILPDGRLPVGQKALELLDFALVSIHSSFRQGKEETTKRVLSALEIPKVKIFAHPTGRKLGVREGAEIDWETVFDFCLRNNKWIEINADPMRLDLPDFLVKEAVDKGVKLTLGTDAHHESGLDNMAWGISVARRGWAKSSDTVNTRTLQEFEKMLE